ncbi:uncharacterized protein b3galt1b isoform X2 [Heterodontus francisci]|uniref:uncharacterized protein b3galt1b isoform X2 n=1 Tax=Heterodontus francisci TaxID=7792 RepID=UPI00355B28C6
MLLTWLKQGGSAPEITRIDITTSFPLAPVPFSWGPQLGWLGCVPEHNEVSAEHQEKAESWGWPSSNIHFDCCKGGGHGDQQTGLWRWRVGDLPDTWSFKYDAGADRAL